MEPTSAQVEFVTERTYEWNRWATAYVQLSRTFDQFVDGVLNRQMAYATIENIEAALAAMIDVQPETLSVILNVFSYNQPITSLLPDSGMAKTQYPAP